MICRLTNTLRELQLKPTMEEVFEADAPNVDDYLRNVHEASILAAIHVSAGMATTVLSMEPTFLQGLVCWTSAALTCSAFTQQSACRSGAWQQLPGGRPAPTCP